MIKLKLVAQVDTKCNQTMLSHSCSAYSFNKKSYRQYEKTCFLHFFPKFTLVLTLSIAIPCNPLCAGLQRDYSPLLHCEQAVQAGQTHKQKESKECSLAKGRVFCSGRALSGVEGGGEEEGRRRQTRERQKGQDEKRERTTSTVWVFSLKYLVKKMKYSWNVQNTTISLFLFYRSLIFK